MSLHAQTPLFQRIAVTLGLGVAFIVMASIFTPERSRASGDDSLSPRRPHAPRIEPDIAPSTDAHAGLRSLGGIESGRYSITIYATDDGPRYTIIARDSGEEIGTLLTPAQIELLLPELDLTSLDFSATSDDAQPLSIADTQG